MGIGRALDEVGLFGARPTLTTIAGVFLRPERRKPVASRSVEPTAACWMSAWVAFELAIVLLRRARPPVPSSPPQVVAVVVDVACLVSDGIADSSTGDPRMQPRMQPNSFPETHTRRKLNTAAVVFLRTENEAGRRLVVAGSCVQFDSISKKRLNTSQPRRALLPTRRRRRQE